MGLVHFWVDNLPRIKIFAIVFFFASLCMLISAVSGVNRDDALTAIARAESAIELGYQAVVAAEAAGANVSGLLEELNVGAEILASAKMFYRVGSFDFAVYFADVCYAAVINVAARADEVGGLAEVDGKWRLYLTVGASTLGVGCVVFGGIFGWRWFKRRYYRRVLERKPEVVTDES